MKPSDYPPGEFKTTWYPSPAVCSGHDWGKMPYKYLCEDGERVISERRCEVCDARRTYSMLKAKEQASLFGSYLPHA